MRSRGGPWSACRRGDTIHRIKSQQGFPLKPGRETLPFALLLMVVLTLSPVPAPADSNHAATFQTADGEEFTTLWSAVLTPGDTSATGPTGYCRAASDGFCVKRPHHGRHDPHGTLAGGELNIDGTVHIVQSLRYGAANKDGKLHLTVDPPFSPDDRLNLVLRIGSALFPLASAFADVWDIGGNYTWIGFEEPWEVGRPITVSLKGPPPGHPGHTPSTANADLRPGISRFGGLETPPDRDWYKVDLGAAVSYHFAARGPRPTDVQPDWYQLDLDTSGSSHLFRDRLRPVAGSLGIALYDSEGEPVRRDGAPVADIREESGSAAAFYFRPAAAGTYYVEVTSPARRPPTWYLIGFWEREPGARSPRD